jgi:hypothetical protein
MRRALPTLVLLSITARFRMAWLAPLRAFGPSANEKSKNLLSSKMTPNDRYSGSSSAEARSRPPGQAHWIATPNDKSQRSGTAEHSTSANVFPRRHINGGLDVHQLPGDSKDSSNWRRKSMLLNCPRNKKEIAKTAATNEAGNRQFRRRRGGAMARIGLERSIFRDDLRFGRAWQLRVQRLADRTDEAERELFARKLGL